MRQAGVDVDVDEVFPCIPNHIFAQQVSEFRDIYHANTVREDCIKGKNKTP